MINICEAINCPLYKHPPSSGCTRYGVSNACHLLYGSQAVSEFDARKVQINGKEYIISPNQYALYTESEEVIAELTKKNNLFFADDEYFKVKQIFELKVALASMT
jgi:hypothetical protein